MKSMFKLSMITALVALCGVGCGSKEKLVEESSAPIVAKKLPVVQIILGSTREGRSSDKLATALKTLGDKRPDVKLELVDIKDYNLPFLYEAVSPAKRTEITDPVIKKWSDKIQEADGFIILVPVYNAGYPGVLKNALDTLYHEWAGKKVAFVGYSGGPSGGASVIEQLRQVTDELGMVHVAQDITIPTAWKALNDQGNFVNTSVEKELNHILDNMLRA